MLAGKRMRVHAALFASLLAVVAIVCGLSAGLVGYLGAAATQGVRAELSGLSGSDLAYQFTLKRAADPAAQDAAARDLIATALASGGRPIDLEVARTIGSFAAVPFTDAVRAAEGSVVVSSVADLDDAAELVDGVWPVSPGEASLQGRCGARPRDPGRRRAAARRWRAGSRDHRHLAGPR